MRDTHPALGPAVAWALDAAEDDGTVPAETLERIKQLGREHRRHGFSGVEYPGHGRAERWVRIAHGQGENLA